MTAPTATSAPRGRGPRATGAHPRPGEEPRRRVAVAVVTAALVTLLAHVAVSLVVRDHGWDDGSITLAFARTWATTGRIALTPHSVQVEGFSSPAWFVLMAGAARIGVTGFDALLRAAQLGAGLCAAAAAGLWVVVAHRCTGAAAAAVLAVALLASAPFLDESMNGMEMCLLTLLVVALARALQVRAPVATAVLAALAATVRFEAVAYLVGAAALGWLLRRRAREGLLVAGGAVGGAGLVEVLRVARFGALVPNTVLAKRWAPYTGHGLRAVLHSHASALGEPFRPLLLGLVVLTALALLLRRRPLPGRPPGQPGVLRAPVDPAVAFSCCYALSVLLVDTAIGHNWGYTARMQLSSLPLVVLALVGLLRRADSRWGPRWGPGRAAVVGVALLAGSAPHLQWTNVRDAVHPTAPHGTALQVTPAEYRTTGRAVERLRATLHVDTVSFLTPDVGGSSLCCTDLDVLDLGLLANPELARSGYAGFDAYLARTAPDVLEVHEVWARESGVYSAPAFVRGYQPVVVGRTWLWVRRDLATRLPVRAPTGVDPATLRYRGDPFDEAHIAALAPRPLYLASASAP